MIGAGKYKHICQKCQTPVELDVPAPRILAGLGMTALVWAQEGLPLCPTCGVGFSLVLGDVKAIQALISFNPIEVKRDSGIVEPTEAELLALRNRRPS